MNHLFLIKKGKSYGYMDFYGNIVIEPKYVDAHVFTNGLAFVKGYNEIGFIDLKGKMQIPININTSNYTVNPFSDGLALIEEHDYDEFNSGISIRDYFDQSGELAFQHKFDFTDSFSNGLALVANWCKYGFINTRGKVAIQPQFESARSFANERAAVKENGKWGLINLKGELMSTFGYDEIGNTGGALIAVKMDGKWGYRKPGGTLGIEPQYDFAGTFSEGLALVVKNGRGMYIDLTGEVKFTTDHNIIEYNIENSYYSTYLTHKKEFNEGVAAVCVNRKWGYIDKTGRWIVTPQFDSIERFSNGLALAETYEYEMIGSIASYESSYIDKTGKIIWTYIEDTGPDYYDFYK